MAETVKVIVRCRPMNKRETGLKCKNCVFMDPKISQCSIVNVNEPNAPAKNFTFDGAYGTDSTTEAIYNEIAYPLVEGVLEGYNGTVFAYGQTGCGKSFTMQGITDPPTQRGIIPRSFEHIFEVIDSSENMKYLVHGSYLEIYNEEIRDLLGTDVKKKLELKEHPDKGIYVPELSQHPVHNTAECEQLMERGWANRAVGATKMNQESSRSHSIFCINIEMMSTSTEQDQHIRMGKLNLVDLAGSERQAKTEATGARLKEATKINLSLSALGNVISALVDGKSKHIPYRDSKLTRLLQDSLGGNTKTMMVACLSPADNNYDETLSTLRYANRAKNIKNKPKINEDPKDAQLREYADEIQRLKALLDGKAPGEAAGFSEEMLEAERSRIRGDYEAEMNEMRHKMESEKESKAKMQKEIETMKRDYEDKLRDLEKRAETAKKQSRQMSIDASGQPAMAIENGHVVQVNGKQQVQPGQPVMGLLDPSAAGGPMLSQSGNFRGPISAEQAEAMAKLKKLQEEMIDGGKRAGDKNLKARRKQKKMAAETRIKALGEALGHVDDEDGVLLKVYDDIQEELRIKTEALKASKQKTKALNAEIEDLQREFEADRTDYLDTIRKQDQQLILLQQILDRIQPMIRKDCNYSHIDKMKSEAVWNDERQVWKIPDLVVQKTKLPPAVNGMSNSMTKGKFVAAATVAASFANATNNQGGSLGSSRGSGSPPDIRRKNHQPTAAAAGHGLKDASTDDDDLEEFSIEDEDDEEGYDVHLQQKLAKSEEEDIVGNYFKPHQRQSQIVTQAQETKRKAAVHHQHQHKASTTSLSANSNLSSTSTLSSSFNSGLNTFGLNNSYNATGSVGSSGNSSLNGSGSQNNGFGPPRGYHGGGGGNLGGGGIPHHGLGMIGGGGSGGLYGASDHRKPSRLEALPIVDRNKTRKKSGPILNTMGTF